MSNVNISKVYLLDVPLENDYKNTLYFTSKSNQQAYFESKIVKSYTDFSYQRKDHYIRIPAHYDDLLNCNYVMYQNSAYSNKWFYAFITDLKYVDDGRTDIFIETDCVQTWFFDYNVKASFIEREHTSNDEAGNNLQPENVELGEYVCNAHVTNADLNNLLMDCVFVLASTHSPYGEHKPTGGVYNGIYSAVSYWVYHDIMNLELAIEALTDDGKADAITGLFMCPKLLAPEEQGSSGGDLYYKVKETTSAYRTTTSINTITAVGNYTPRNKKLLTYPYNYLLVSNNNGGSGIFNFEDFETVTVTDSVGATYQEIKFIVEGAICPGGSIRLIPYAYRGVAENDEHSVNAGKTPICSYPVDMYTNWLTQNAVNIGLDIASNVANAGIGITANVMTGNVPGAVASGVGGVMGVANSIAQVHVASLQPYQARGNLNAGDVVYASKKNTFHFYYMNIREEYAKIIDGYFDMFGYKTNKVKVPNKAHRSRWWYTKTIDVNIDGAIPNKDMQIIKNCYNNGITFWRNASEIQNYSLSNEVAITSGAVTE